VTGYCVLGRAWGWLENCTSSTNNFGNSSAVLRKQVRLILNSNKKQRYKFPRFRQSVLRPSRLRWPRLGAWSLITLTSPHHVQGSLLTAIVALTRRTRSNKLMSWSFIFLKFVWRHFKSSLFLHQVAFAPQNIGKAVVAFVPEVGRCMTFESDEDVYLFRKWLCLVSNQAWQVEYLFS
jgi:hypothetical protein